MSREREEFEKLSPEEKRELAILGNMLAQPLSEEDAYMQKLMDACIDAREQEAKE